MKVTAVRSTGPLRNLQIPRDLPNLVVITGPNGAGKTYLLRAFESRAIETDVVRNDGIERYDTAAVRDVVYIERNFGEISNASAKITSTTDPTESFVIRFEQLRAGHSDNSSLRFNLIFEGVATPYFIDVAERRLGKPLIEASRDELMSVAPLLHAPVDPLHFPISELFASYESRRRFHRYRRFVEVSGDLPAGSSLSDSDFVAQYGDPPWELLDEVLSAAGVPYRFVPPSTGTTDEQYTAELRHVADETVVISPLQLSLERKHF